MFDVNNIKTMFEEKGIPGKCPMCDFSDFTALPMPQMMNNYDPVKKAIQMGNGVPFAVIICNNCNYTLLFNAKAFGL